MNSVSINQRVENLKNDEASINSFIEEYKPFIASCVEKETNRYVRYGEDDELSIGLIAFVEAIKSFDSRKGSFLSFAQNVIKRRLIDYYRKERKHSVVVSINQYVNDEDGTELDLSTEQSLDSYSEQEISEYRRLELHELKKELEDWGITFEDLVKSCPKHGKTRRLCADIISFLFSHTNLLTYIKTKRQLPIVEIEGGMHIPRKKIERARKYILAAIIIKTGDYQYISDYIDWG